MSWGLNEKAADQIASEHAAIQDDYVPIFHGIGQHEKRR